MYHYQKNIGDYRSATMHLSLLEHGVYNQLLDWYYLDEQPLPADNRTLFRRLSARSEVEQQAVLDVLSEMFVQSDVGWSHKRVDREITQYKERARQAREAGKLGGRPPKKGVGSENNRDGFEKEATAKPTANREPLTDNQEPEEKKAAPRKRSAPTTVLPTPDDVDPQTWVDFLEHRKAKRAPVTETVMKNARSEAAAAGMDLDAFLQVWCARGSQGLQADWLKPHERNTASRVAPVTFAQQDERDRRKRWEEMTGRQWPEAGNGPDFIEAEDITPKRIDK
jgi:uncharacterized protein YdaU (DUF1376 family)